MQTNYPFLCISIDFELYWGVRDVLSLKSYGKNILIGRESVPLVLQLFNKYNVSATWAVVGMSSFPDKKTLLNHIPSNLPNYHNSLLCPYKHLGEVGKNEKLDPYHFGYSLVDQISQTLNMEIASHSYSHFYALEPRKNMLAFEDDLNLSIEVLKNFYNPISSIVFCRNQYDNVHLSMAKKCGFKFYRGNELNNFNKSFSYDKLRHLKRIIRNLDSYVNLTGPCSSQINNANYEMINIPSSRFLRPYSNSALEYLKIRRIMNAMEMAAINKKGFHIWWHPENFGNNLKLSLESLEKILIHYSFLNQRYGMISETMSKIGSRSIEVASL